MRERPDDASTVGITVLLIEVNPDARAKHSEALAAGGYTVTAAEAWPPVAQAVHPATILISDVPSFHLLGGSAMSDKRPVVVLADDARAGVAACLHGADAWVPTHGDGAYLLDTIAGVARPRLAAESRVRSKEATWATTGATTADAQRAYVD